MSVELALRTPILRGITGFLELSHPKPWIPESTPRISRIPDSKDFPKSAIRFTLHWGILWGFNLEKNRRLNYDSFFQGLLLRGLIGFRLVFNQN